MIKDMNTSSRELLVGKHEYTKLMKKVSNLAKQVDEMIIANTNSFFYLLFNVRDRFL